MRISVILAHPKKGSFNHAIAKTVCDAVGLTGDIVCNFHDLYAEGFNPLLPPEELQKDALFPPLIEQHINEICEADGIVIVHPNWWGSSPAILAGWRDRCLRAGKAYRFESDGKGGGRSVGMLKAQFVLLFNTLNTPVEVEEKILGNPMFTYWKNIVFALCGVDRVVQKLIGPVIMSTDEQRKAWLEDVKSVVNKEMSCF